MDDVDTFLNQNPGLKSSGEGLGTAITEVRLQVVVFAISPVYVEFSYMGTDFRVDRKDVLGIEESKESSALGKVATLKLKRDTVLLSQQSVSAHDLGCPLPFSLARPSPVSAQRGAGPSQREMAWRQLTGYLNPEGIGNVTFLAVASGSDTASYGHSDDSGFDDCKLM
jgi:hypothetical protein